MDRNKIEDKYKWDLTEIFNCASDFYDEANKLIEDIEIFCKKVKGHIMDSGDSLYEYLKDSEALEERLENVFCYAHLQEDIDTSNHKFQEAMSKAINVYDKYVESSSFVLPEILKSDYKKLLSENDKLKEYEIYLERLFLEKKHILSESEENIIALASSALDTSSDVFERIDNTDIKLDDIIDESGNTIKLTQSNYSTYLKSTNQEIRKQAFKSMYKYYINLKHTLAANYAGQVKSRVFTSKVRKYESVLSMSLENDYIDKLVIETLISSVNNNLDILQDYIEDKKELLKLDEIHMYDISAGASHLKQDNKIEFDEAKDMVLDALEPLGKEYLEVLKSSFDNNWIDVYPSDAKRSGGYCNGTLRLHPYVLLNYEGEINDTEILAHELGHAMHSYLSNKNQPNVYRDYGIFLGEIASTVNETLLSDYLITKTKDKKEKLSMLIDTFEKLRATYYRQVMFTEFEKCAYDTYESGGALTTDFLYKTYLELNKKYFGKNVVIDEEIGYEWSRIPHFYLMFYAYKYATGISAAFAIVDKLRNEKDFKDKYINFLSSGCSKYPLDLLNELGIDMTSSKPYDKMAEALRNYEQQIKELIKEVMEV